MRHAGLAAFIIISIALLHVPAEADIYRFVDNNGIVYFTDYPKHDGFKMHIREGTDRGLVTSRGYYPYREVVRKASTLYEVEEPLLRAVIEIESDYNRYAVSRAGARGLMQLMPETMQHLGVRNPWDPVQNINAGTRYLKKLMKRFSGDLSLALAAYNAGSTSVIKYGSIPPFPQTERYVKKVLERYQAYSGFE